MMYMLIIANPKYLVPKYLCSSVPPCNRVIAWIEVDHLPQKYWGSYNHLLLYYTNSALMFYFYSI